MSSEGGVWAKRLSMDWWDLMRLLDIFLAGCTDSLLIITQHRCHYGNA